MASHDRFTLRYCTVFGPHDRVRRSPNRPPRRWAKAVPEPDSFGRQHALTVKTKTSLAPQVPLRSTTSGIAGHSGPLKCAREVLR